jgi:hypothetical protein
MARATSPCEIEEAGDVARERLLGFRGPATLCVDERKLPVDARMYYTGSVQTGLEMWGYYLSDQRLNVETRRGYMRFADGSEAEVEIEARSPTCGRFNVVGGLRDSTRRE